MDTLETSQHSPPQSLLDEWIARPPEERIVFFRQLSREDAAELFLSLGSKDQSLILEGLPTSQQKIWMRVLAPDDAADVLQELSHDKREELVQLLDPQTRSEVIGLLSYEEDVAGGLMSPRFSRLRAEATIAEAIFYLRRQAKAKVETIYYTYVFDRGQRLIGIVSFRDLFSAEDDKKISEVMETDILYVFEDTDQETVAQLMADHDLAAIPVVDQEGHMKGIITLDDIVDVVQEEATEDIQKIGGSEALETSYMQTSFLSLVRKRAGWLMILFIGEMLTATAMSNYEQEIANAVVLALFVPLIISSGGNSGSQASTLVIRALALREIWLGDWWRVFRRELASGILLGGILALIGLMRILLWQWLFGSYGDHFWLVGFTVALSVVGVVTWGTIAGSMLPFILRALKLDPASASAPFVATLVDVCGLIIYFNVAHFVMKGVLL